MKREKFLVIGLGSFGRSVAKELASDGGEVVAVDESPLHIDRIKDKVAAAVEGDATDIKVLEQLGAADFDAAVVCIGEHFEAAVLSTANLLDLGVPYVAARSNNAMAASILRRIGAHHVFNIESQMGSLMAHKLRQPTLITEMDLGHGYRIIQWKAPKTMFGKKLADMALPKNYRIQVIAIRNEDSEDLKTPKADTEIKSKDLLLISGYEKDLSSLFSAWKSED